MQPLRKALVSETNELKGVSQNIHSFRYRFTVSETNELKVNVITQERFDACSGKVSETNELKGYGSEVRASVSLIFVSETNELKVA